MRTLNVKQETPVTNSQKVRLAIKIFERYYLVSRKAIQLLGNYRDS